MTVKEQAAVILRAAEGGAFDEAAKGLYLFTTDDAEDATLATVEALLGEPVLYLSTFDRPYRDLRGMNAWRVVRAARSAWLRRSRS